MVERLLKLWCRKDIYVCGAGIMGNILLLTGILTAALDARILGFTPVIWILLAFICYVTMIFSVALSILVRLEAKE